ncbi:Mim2p NDAI_0B02530 [Naumovozyma dairenensis CBS 421]|uniref:Uncharacterized protein n=1 Tax=Naumovozyma dairenensis (strain ATCC 10597 / BCRC 20456 / CBS 421 / NBRC 0211 / NRRL Y-12639) TaxID=1071378 RepID=G0W677_NAUDC|nr:hypothetical protein NDAI_0B02530 [Naumovozyma dairenensis CBS 421]CCD23288.1 hypothetical protein NDAI_0B02530 [Naumovozyma dairenensis CBS 421]
MDDTASIVTADNSTIYSTPIGTTSQINLDSLTQELEVEGEEEDYECAEEETESDIETIDYNAALVDAQRQWEQSLDQLNKVFNWILLPMIGKVIGRRSARVIWQRVMNTIWN